MLPNRFGSPHFPQGGGPSFTKKIISNNNINENPSYLTDLCNPSNSSTSSSSSNMNVDNDYDKYLKSVVGIDEKPTQKLVCNNSSSTPPLESSVYVNLNRKLSNGSNSQFVDEVWEDIVQQTNENFRENGEFSQIQPQQNSLSDQAFEEYMVHSSAIIAGNNQNIIANQQPFVNVDQMVAVSQPQPDWLQFQTTQHVGEMGSLPISGSLIQNSLADVRYPDNNLSLSLPMPLNVSPLWNSESLDEKKKKVSDEKMEKTIARRQKRMFKNRESAARSRAKKQAYIDKLEFEGAELAKKIKLLKKEKEIDMLLNSDPKQCPRNQLRRTTSL